MSRGLDRARQYPTQQPCVSLETMKKSLFNDCKPTRRDLTWSRHQLEELAERRFLAAQNSEMPRGHVPSPEELQFQVNALSEKTSFQDLFKKVAHADFSSYLAKLQVSPFPLSAHPGHLSIGCLMHAAESADAPTLSLLSKQATALGSKPSCCQCLLTVMLEEKGGRALCRFCADGKGACDSYSLLGW